MRITIILLISLIVASILFFMGGCSTTPTSSGGNYIVYSIFWGNGYTPYIYMTDGGPNYSRIVHPLTGTDITGATVTISNETTGLSTIAAYTSIPTSSVNAIYMGKGFLHASHESVSVKIQKGSTMIIGATTITPTAEYTIKSPTGGTIVQLPFIISWEVNTGTDAPTHTYVEIMNKLSTEEAKNYQVFLPIAQTSLEVTSSILDPSFYGIIISGVKTMSYTGAKVESIGYIAGGIGDKVFNVTVEAAP